MKENKLFFPNGPIIDPDDELTNYSFKVASRIIFPKEGKDKGKRNLFLKSFGFNRSKAKAPGSHSILDEAKMEISKGVLVGETCRTLILLSLDWERMPSIRFLDYAAKEGAFLYEWGRNGYPVRSIKPLFSKFGSVKHLWCADVYTRLIWERENTRSLHYLFDSPSLFLGFASLFRDMSVDIGLAQKKTELWMPKGWHDKALYPKIEEVCPSCEWESQRRMLEKLWHSYTEEKAWMDCV